MRREKIHTLSDYELKELHNTLLEIYRDVSAVCDKYGLCLMLGGGSCLGAVRHKGIIPWDDDLDVNMLRADYDKLLRVFNLELSDKYDLVNLNTTKSGQVLHTKIMKKGTRYLQTDSYGNNDPQGIFIDVFPIEALPDNSFYRSVFLYLAHKFTILTRFIIHYQLNPHMKRKYRKNFKFYLIGEFTSVLSVYKWGFLYNKFISSCKGEKFFTIPSGMREIYGEIQSKDTFFPVVKGVFEGMEVSLPGNYHKYLTSLYGNYMKFPPLHEQKPSHKISEFSSNTASVI